MQNELSRLITSLLRSQFDFSEAMSQIRLRDYQRAVAETVLRSVFRKEGLSIVVMFPRQSGKNELQAQIEVYLLTILSTTGGEIVKVSPTWKPQSLNAMRRLQRTLERNLLTHWNWRKEAGYLYRLGQAQVTFLSGEPTANIVGATASTLLEVDEAQDVLVSKFDKDISPMAASTNATRVFWGTAWTSNTLLARELRAAQAAEEKDGKRRVFRIGADEVAAEVPAYGNFVAEQVGKLGRQHPMIKTQFFSEEIDSEGGMFPPARRSLMAGQHAHQSEPVPGKLYALLLDVAGEDEGITGETGELANTGRDSTALTVVEVDLSGLSDPVLKAPIYRVVDRRQWLGVKHTQLYAQLRSLAESWNARHLVVDATGIGAGLASFLDRALPGRVIPFVFNASTKSRLGWEFLGIIETGRFKDWKQGSGGVVAEKDRAMFWRQLEECALAIQPGPDRKMRWGIPDGKRDSATGELLHDDLILSAALVAELDALPWSAPGGAVVVRAADPLRALDQEGF